MAIPSSSEASLTNIGKWSHESNKNYDMKYIIIKTKWTLCIFYGMYRTMYCDKMYIYAMS